MVWFQWVESDGICFKFNGQTNPNVWQNQRSDPKEQEIIICYTTYNVLYYDSNDISCGTDTEDEPFPSQKKEILQALRDSKQRARKVKDFMDFTMITKIRSPQGKI